MKIKQEKKFTLPQLIEWAWANPELSKNKRFISENKENTGVKQYVIFNDFCYAEVENSYCYGPVDLFTVEVDEEITEDTQISKLAHYSVYGFRGTKNCTSINDVKDGNSIAFYIINDDLTMTLIWTHEKGLVE